MNVSLNLYNVTFRGELRATKQETLLNKPIQSAATQKQVLDDAVTYSISAQSPFDKVKSVDANKVK